MCLIPRHTVVCHVVRKCGEPHCVCIDRNKEIMISCLHSSMALSPQHTILHLSCPTGRAGQTADLIKFTPAICELWAFKNSNFLQFFLKSLGVYRGLNLFLHTLQNAINCMYVTQLPFVLWYKCDWI